MNKNSTGFANLKNKTTTFEKLFRKAPPPPTPRITSPIYMYQMVLFLTLKVLNQLIFI